MEGGGEAGGKKKKKKRREEVSLFLGVICLSCWVWVAGRRADAFRHTDVNFVSPHFVIVIDKLLLRLAEKL